MVYLGFALAVSPTSLESSTVALFWFTVVITFLALGILRMRARTASDRPKGPNQSRRFGLDFAAGGSVSDTDAHAQRSRR